MRTFPCGINSAARRAESRAALSRNIKHATLSAIALILGAVEFYTLLVLGGAA